MPCDIKRSIPELISLLKFEPRARCVAVEGTVDRDMIDTYIERKGRVDVHVYAIDDIDVPASIMRKHGLDPDNHRDRVVGLAHAISTDACVTDDRMMCIIDADFDRHLGRCIKQRCLVYTDYTSMEMYFFCEDFIRKLATFMLRKRDLDVDELLQKVAIAMQQVFILRLANEKLGWKMRISGIADFLSIGPLGPVLNVTRLTDHVLRSSGRLPQSADLDAAVRGLSAKLDPDPRNNIRGHDFTLALHLYLQRWLKLGVTLGGVETLERVLYGYMEPCFVDSTGLFQRLATL